MTGRLGGHRRTVLATSLLVMLAVAAPSTALAAVTSTTNPLSGFPSAPVSTASSQTQPVVTNATSSTAGSSSLSSGNAFAIAVGAVIVLSGISFFIWRDARKRAPVKGAGDSAEDRARRGTKPQPKPRKPSPAERRRRKRGRAKR